MTLRNAFEALGLDTTLQAIRDRLPLQTPAGRLPVDIGSPQINGTFTTRPSVASVSNIPPGPLAANAMFVGEWEDVLDYAAVQVGILTDAASTTNGAVIEFSTDGINVLRTVPTTIPANFAAYFHLAPEARYVRFRYTNGPVAQTLLRLSIQFAYQPPADVVQPIGSQITDANVATIVSSHIKARTSSGLWQALASDGLGKLGVYLDRTLSLLTRDEIAFYASPEGGHQAFNITTGIVTIAATGEQQLALLVNPANSGLDMWLDLGEFGSSANTTFRRRRVTSFTTSGAGVSPSNMSGVTANTSPFRFYLPTFYTVSSPVVTKTAHIAAFQQYLTNVKGKTRLRPGQAIEWVINGPGGLGGSMTASIYFEFWQKAAA